MDDHKHTGYIKITTFFPSGIKKEDILEEWEDMIAEGLGGLQQLDPAICILREDDNDREYTIHAKQHMPKFFRQWRQIVKLNSANVLGMNTPENKPRKVVCSSLMFFSVEPRAFVEESTVDLSKVKTSHFSTNTSRPYTLPGS